MIRFYVVFFPIVFCACGGSSTDFTTKPITKTVPNITATQDQAERRQKSEAYCKSYNVPLYQNPGSLFVDPEAQITLRTQDEIVDRVLALFYLGLKSEGLEASILAKIDKQYNISAKFSPREKAYALATQPTAQQSTDANWRYESLHVMLWALNLVDSLSYPSQLCNVAADVKILHDLTEVQLRKKAQLRSKLEIIDQADLILRLHWACVNARVKGEAIPSKLEKSVVFERHYSLNWLIRYLNADWDDVSTNT